MESGSEPHSREDRRRESFRDRMVYSFQVAIVVYVSVVLVFGAECFSVFLRYYPLI